LLTQGLRSSERNIASVTMPDENSIAASQQTAQILYLVNHRERTRVWPRLCIPPAVVSKHSCNIMQLAGKTEHSSASIQTAVDENN
jgi:hypothetical protein